MTKNTLAHTSTTNTIPISVCLIAKNEEKHVKNCLEPLQKLGFEIVVTDTGSTDKTVELAKEYTPNIFHFSWCDNFSAARNYCIDKATRPYILVIDFDEYLSNIHISALLKATEQTGIGMVTRNNHQNTDSGESIMTERVGRFFCKENYCYKGRIHEQLAPKNNNVPSYYSVPVTLEHYGYTHKQDTEEKAKRNLDLLLKDLEEDNTNPYTYFQIGQSYRALNDYENALQYYDTGLSFEVDPALEYVQTMVESYGYCLLELKQMNEALQLQNIYNEFSKRADFVFLMGLIYMNAGLFQDAIKEFRKATTISNYATLGTNSFLAWYNIGVIYEVLGYTNDALASYEKCGTYPPAQNRINELRAKLH